MGMDFVIKVHINCYKFAVRLCVVRAVLTQLHLPQAWLTTQPC